MSMGIASSLGNAVLVYVEPGYGPVAGRVRATIETLLTAAGFRARVASSAQGAHLRYGAPSAERHCVAPSSWERIPAAVPTVVEGLTVPSCAVRAVDGAASLRDVDPFFAAYFFLTGRHEGGLEQPGQAAPSAAIGQWGVLDRPVVDVFAARLMESLRTTADLAAPRPRWPDGNRWALALSHDCDRPLRYLAAGYMRDCAQHLRRGSASQSAKSGLKAAYAVAAGLTGEDPFARSAREFIAFERRHEIRSTFFFASSGRHDPDSSANDLGYNYATRSVQRLARSIADEGMELGLHSSIRAWEFANRFEEEAQRFAAGFGCRPQGVRAHWWSLKPGAHEDSMRVAARAGFVYDSSLGMNERSGFRRGTAYPFLPFDPLTGEHTGLVEVPPTIMDDALLLEGGNPVATLRRRLEMVRDSGGVLVLDWHSDVLRTPRWGQMSADVLAEVSKIRRDDSSCWFASLGEISDWTSRGRFQHGNVQ
jgi:hypothetical protein